MVAQRVLYDVRDSNSYTVRKLADGGCWMVENLRLTGSKTLTPSNSDVSSNWTLPAPNTSFPPSSCVNTAYSMAASSDSALNYGNYYNWYATTAGTGTCDASSSDAGSSICPKGWKLPTGGSSGQLQTLYSQYSSSTAMRADPVNFVLSGYRYGSSTDHQGSSGFYWSSTALNSNRTYSLRVTSSDVYPQNNTFMYLGLAVRCVAQ